MINKRRDYKMLRMLIIKILIIRSNTHTHNMYYTLIMDTQIKI